MNHILARVIEGWGPSFCDARVRPLPRGDALTHTASLFLLESANGAFVVKESRASALRRAPPFPRIKYEILEHCKAHSVDVLSAIPNVHGEPLHTVGETTLELSRYIEGQPAGCDAASVLAMVKATLALGRAFDTVPADLRERLRAIPTLSLVDEPDVARAMAQAKELRDLALEGDDAWSRLACDYLAPIDDLAPYFASVLEEARQGQTSLRIGHHDLHRAHLLFPSSAAAPVIIDFDNMAIGDPALDMAWICDQAAATSEPSGANVAVLDVALHGFLSSDEVTRADLRRGIVFLIAYAIPIVVDIGKDILVRRDRRDIWRWYLNIVDVGRKKTVLERISGAYRDSGERPLTRGEHA